MAKIVQITVHNVLHCEKKKKFQICMHPSFHDTRAQSKSVNDSLDCVNEIG